MTQIWYPSAAHNGEAVTDTEYERLAIAYATSGLIGVPTGSPLAFGDSSGMVVKLRANSPALVRGGLWIADATVSLDVDDNTSGTGRYDLVVLRLDRGAEGGANTTGVLIKGTAGSGVPAPVQDDVGAGRWDLPVGVVRVNNGAVAIAAGDVTPAGWYVGEPIYVCTSATRPPHKYGRFIQDETGFLFSNGTSWHHANSQDTSATCAQAPGWKVVHGSVRKFNSIVYSQLQFTRTEAPLSSSTVAPMGTVPSGYRPTRTVYAIAYGDGADTILCEISAAGVITVNGYFGETIGTGETVSLGDLSWIGA